MAEMDNSDLAAAPASSSGLAFSGLYQVLISPIEFFAKLKETPKLLVPYILLGICWLVGFFLLKDYIVDLQLEAMRGRDLGASGVTPEDLRGFTEISAVVGGVLTMLIYPVLAAAIALFWGNVVMAGMAKFRQLVSVVLYGEIVAVVGMFLTLPLIYAKDSILVGLSLGALVSPDPKSIPFVILSKISIWFVWEIIVVGLGFSAVYGFSRNKGMVLSVLTIGILTLVNVLMSIVGILMS